MAIATQKAIRFLHRWRGRNPGDIDTVLTAGIQDALVGRHIAEWVKPQMAQPTEDRPSQAKPFHRKGKHR